MSQYPLLSNRQWDEVLAWRPCGPVTVRAFVADAQAMAAALPQGEWVINLCEDRYQFAVLFAACLLGGKTSLQPSSQSPHTLLQLAQDYPGAWAVSDGPLQVPGLACWRYPALTLPTQPSPKPVDAMPMLAGDRVVAILFTSGSTGRPQPHAKTWGKMVQNGRTEAQLLGLHPRPHALVGTVPVQHSYGFESTFLMALHGGCSFWSGKPFYPQDVVDALNAVPQPRMLVTTPHHLNALLHADVHLPAVDFVLSATAALSAELAAQTEQRTGAPVFEIYGSTESSQVAMRRTTDGPAWHMLPGIVFEQNQDCTYAQGAHVEGRVPLSDIIEFLGNGDFLLHGRHADLINMAGKRTSLAYLNHQLCAIEGVRDGVFFMPDVGTVTTADADGGLLRLCAFVVAPMLDKNALMAQLRQRIDAIFLPRPLLLVPALPRNSTGKLPHSALQALYQEQVLHGRR